ncbi:HTH domain-containing protein [Mucilaginibacter psychrotolerans]|uniref:XRE family transcriptional regulator n=1 Tax=Mucilaginibacter psychrotolerans TaxID=1524096 RepID=A0A4Y8S2K4_9SPHI|nr:HTH domain-containing protein [Mucilaginibacter psychrotolerans]TFF33279.1 XRE family transcriptional regulator [Mucilaginibacter psychrotolerans]
MEKHYGQIVEYIVRKNGYSITDLAVELNVNRRTIYNYFQNKTVKYDVIYKIGLIVRHDFSKDFPELFTSDQFEINQRSRPVVDSLSSVSSDSNYWQDKYIQLLEAYNTALTERIAKNNQPQLAAVNS